MNVIIMHKHKLRLSASDCYTNYVEKSILCKRNYIIFVKNLYTINFSALLYVSV